MSWKPRSLVLDLFGDYLRYAGGEARLGEITELLAVFGIEPATVRVNLSRLKKEGWFTTRRVGRETVYCLSAHMLEILDEGLERIFHRRDNNWPGRWTMVIYQVPESDRAVREQLRKQLAWNGFGQLSPSTWISPQDLFSRVQALASEYEDAKIDVLWCGSIDLGKDRELAVRCWDLSGLAADYHRFIADYSHLDDPAANAALDGRQALMERMRIIGDFRRFPFRDPQLPLELQPENWPGDEAYDLFRRVHGQLGPAAESFVRGITGNRFGDSAANVASASGDNQF